MGSVIDPEELLAWCRVPASELVDHPQAKVRIRILPTPAEVDQDFAMEVVQEIERNNASGQPTRLILPCGPRGPVRHITHAVNQRRISLRDVHVFHMDDHLDWQGRRLPVDHPFSYFGWMERHFYGEIDPELNVPAAQRHWPSTEDPDGISRAMERVGGIDTVYGGVGYRGHIAYNEPPRSPWHTISDEAFRESKTRILQLNDDTLISLSERAAGGCSQSVPPMAITLGMHDLLGARRIRLYSGTGSWKQTVIRVLLFGPVTPEYPVTYCQEHPDFVMTVDEATAEAPLLEPDVQMQRLVKE